MKKEMKLEVGVYVILVLVVKGSTSIPIQRHGVHGIIESPGFPKHYSNNLNITWVTNGPIDAISFMVTILQFDVYYDPRFPCQDLLTITELETNFDFFNRCGNISKTSYIVLGNKLKFTFRTDGVNTAKGFRIHWEVKDYREEGKEPIVRVHYCPQSSSPLTTETSTVTNDTGDLTEHVEKLLFCETSIMSFVKDGIIGVLSTALLVITVAFCCHRSKSSPRESKTDYSVVSNTSSQFSTFESETSETQTIYDYPLGFTLEAVDFLRSTTSSGYAIPTPGSPNSSEPPIYGNVLTETENEYRNVECEYMNISTVSQFKVGMGDRPGDKSLHLPNPVSRNTVLSSRRSTQQRVNRSKNKKRKNRKVEESNYLNIAPTLHSYTEVVGDGTDSLLCDSFKSMTSSGYSKPMDNATKRWRQLQCTKKNNIASRGIVIHS